jgi:tellurite resistance protein TerC
MLFQYFAVPREYQHRVLFWGIIGAVAMRGLMIAIGAQLVAQFSWVLYIFGGILILTAIKMAFFTSEDMDPAQNFIIRHVRRRFPRHRSIPRRALLHQRGQGWMLTPLALSLVMVETTDLIFAVDSIPAIFAITADPFLVFTSNVFAILGLRSLYFALAGALARAALHEARTRGGVAGGRRQDARARADQDALGENFNLYLLGVVLTILGIGVVASLLHRTGNATSHTSSPGAADLKSTK